MLPISFVNNELHIRATLRGVFPLKVKLRDDDFLEFNVAHPNSTNNRYVLKKIHFFKFFITF